MFKNILFAAVFLCSTVYSEREMTLAIIKPDGVKEKHIGDILARYEKEGFEIVGLKMELLNNDKAKTFYAEHRERPFFNDLVSYMTSGPIVVIALSGDEAITRNRKLMGSTDPKKAELGTLRALYGESLSKNAVHGSDSKESAKREVYFFFKPEELSVSP